MKYVQISVQNKTVAALLQEQLARLANVKIAEDENQKPDLVIDDDFIDMPLRLGEAVDRIRYLLSGRNRFSGPLGKLYFNGLEFDAEDSSLTDRESANSIKLTDKERLIVTALYDAPDHQLSRKDLLQTAWGYGENIETHTLETHLYRLRQKIEEGLGRREFIETFDGIYRLINPAGS